ncbi:fibrinogen-like protein A [Branchiostoma floridae x Branchiostoma belcheri]
MWFYRLVVLTAILQWSVGTGEDQFSLSLCKLWEDCVKTVKVAEAGEIAKLQTVCQDVADMLETRDVQNCGSLLSGGEEKQANNEHHPQPFLASLALGMFGRTNYFTDCSQIHTALAMFNDVTSGEHDIKPLGMSSPISVYCDQTTDGGGWTVIQRRFDGSIDFNRPWGDYSYGFGSANGEYWLGLEAMYHLTFHNAYELYIELEDWSGVVKYARYSSFSVWDGSTNYRLNVDGYSGTAGDGFGLSYSASNGAHLNGQGFSARDVDNDESSLSCANSVAFSGGWWYKKCTYSALNGPYLRPSDRTDHSGAGVYWSLFSSYSYRYYLKKSKMMIRPSDFQP